MLNSVSLINGNLIIALEITSYSILYVILKNDVISIQTYNKYFLYILNILFKAKVNPIITSLFLNMIV